MAYYLIIGVFITSVIEYHKYHKKKEAVITFVLFAVALTVTEDMGQELYMPILLYLATKTNRKDILNYTLITLFIAFLIGDILVLTGAIVPVEVTRYDYLRYAGCLSHPNELGELMMIFFLMLSLRFGSSFVRKLIISWAGALLTYIGPNTQTVTLVLLVYPFMDLLFKSKNKVFYKLTDALPLIMLAVSLLLTINANALPQFLPHTFLLRFQIPQKMIMEHGASIHWFSGNANILLDVNRTLNDCLDNAYLYLLLREGIAVALILLSVYTFINTKVKNHSLKAMLAVIFVYFTMERYIEAIWILFPYIISFAEPEKSVEDDLYRFVKRLADILISGVGVICLLPFSLIMKIIYLATGDKGPIFYSHIRVGKDGKEFRLYKYRTMYIDADEKLKEMLKDEKYKKEWDAKQKLNDDPRITPVGMILRTTSLDEIPQLINILKGDMSLIGPRPLVPGELEAHTNSKEYWQVKPGLTGWWGCNGRSDKNYEERLGLEYYYIRNCSIKLDMICIFKTIKTVICREGAQ